jgi:hypothetical protein
MHAIPFASGSSFSSDSSCFGSDQPPSCPQELLPCSPLPFRSHHAQRKQSACCSDAGASHCDEEAPTKAPRLPPLFRLERTNIALECEHSTAAVAVVVEALEAALLNARCNILRRRRQKCRWACQYLVGCGDFVDLRVKLFSFQVSTFAYNNCCALATVVRCSLGSAACKTAIVHCTVLLNLAHTLLACSLTCNAMLHRCCLCVVYRARW